MNFQLVKNIHLVAMIDLLGSGHDLVGLNLYMNMNAKSRLLNENKSSCYSFPSPLCCLGPHATVAQNMAEVDV